MLFFIVALVGAALADSSATIVPKDTLVDTVYVTADGIPWNQENFDPSRLLRHESFDPAIKVAYTYSVNFIEGSFGTYAGQSFLAHFAYDFSPDLHLYANMGLWMPLYSNLHFGTPIAKEDVRQGNVGLVIPDITLEYKPSENVNLRLMLVNERDAFRAYGPRNYFYGSCNPWRNSIFCR